MVHDGVHVRDVSTLSKEVTCEVVVVLYRRCAVFLRRTQLQAAVGVATDENSVVVVTPEETVFTSNKATVVAVTRAAREVREPVPLEGKSWAARALAFTAETATRVLKLIPSRDSVFKGLLEAATVEGTNDSVTVRTRDGQRQYETQVHEARVGDVAAVVKTLRGVLGDRLGRVQTWVPLNRKRLLALLEAVDKSCADTTSGFAPVILGFDAAGEALVILARDGRSDCRVIGTVGVLRGDEQALEIEKYREALSFGKPILRRSRLRK